MTRPLTILTLIAAVSLSFARGDQARGASDGRAGTAPVFFEKEVREKYVALGDSGAALLRAGRFDDALAIFAEMETVIPGGPWARFNRACAYSQSGRISEAIEELDRACEDGFDNVAALQGSADLAPVLRDSRSEKIIRRAQKNSDKHLAYLSQGLPAATPLPVPADSIDAYTSRESRRLYEQYGVWHTWQLRTAMLEARSRHLESMRLAKKDDPQFDYGLNRIRLLANVVSIAERWGVVADGVKREAEKYLATNPPPAGRAEATYYLGVAAFCRERPSPASSEWKDAAGNARRIFAQVDTTTIPAGAAAAWLVALDLLQAGDAKQPVYPKVLQFSTRWANNQPAQTIANALFKIELIRARWPVPFDVVDLEGKPVTLEQYRGKLLLIDFWATWCGPCRNELPALKDAYAKYHDRGLEILSISLDYPQKTTPEMYRDWVSENGMTWRHVYDQKNFTSPLAQGFNVQSIPAPFLIGRDGVPVAMLDDLRGPNLSRSIEKAL